MQLRSHAAHVTCHKLFVTEFYIFFKFDLVFKNEKYIFDSCLDQSKMVKYAIEIDYGYFESGNWHSLKVLKGEFFKNNIKNLQK